LRKLVARLQINEPDELVELRPDIVSGSGLNGINSRVEHRIFLKSNDSI
jgi:hypothetical protein